MILTNLTFIDDNNVVVGFTSTFVSGKIVFNDSEGKPQPDLTQEEIAKHNESEFFVLTQTTNAEGKYEYDIQLKNNYRYFEYNDGPEGDPQVFIGYTYDENRNAFIPPCPIDGYILDDTTLEWKPDPTRLYDKDGDGKLYRYNEETLAWYPEY
jgi:hypothetical protein